MVGCGLRVAAAATNSQSVKPKTQFAPKIKDV